MNSDPVSASVSASVDLLRQSLAQSLATPERGIPAIVNDLFKVARRHAVHLDGTADTCRVRVDGADDTIEMPLPRPMVRKVLAHVAIYCKKQNADVTSPYAGRTTVTVAGSPVNVAFTNSAEEQTLALTPGQAAAPEPSAPPAPPVDVEDVVDDDLEPQQQTMRAPQQVGRREQYIPLRRADLVEMLASEKGVTPEERDQFRRFCDIYAATLHFEYKKLYESLKNTYTPFDPECVTVTVRELSKEDRKATLEELFERVDELLRKANFTPLSEADLKRALALASDWGINMQVDMTLFEKVRLYMRGDGVGQRFKKPWYAPWKEEVMVEVPTYSRLALIVKMKKDKRLPKDIDTEDVFLKYFKDIPQADLEMLLPGARIVMPGMHRIKLGGSIVSGFGIMVWQVIKATAAITATGMVALLSLPVALFGYGWKQYAGYQNARHQCSLRLTQSLYFQTLANNAGVLYCLLDEAEEQDAREALLAYFFLWKHAGPRGMTMAELDKAIEADLAVKTGQDIDFEVDDALAKLEKLKLVAVDPSGRYVAMPIEEALERLDYLWDNQFTYNKAAAV